MVALFIVLGVIAFVAASLFFGGINHKIQRRRCRATGCRWECSHGAGSVAGYPLWFIILPATLAYELAVGRLGEDPKPNLSRLQKRIAKEQEKQRLIAEQERTLAAEKRVLELRLDIARLGDIATDGKGTFPTKDFTKA